MEFEHKNYKVPSGYDEWLRALYGNYMEFATMNWGTQKYLGSLDRIANEVFNVNSTEGINYRIVSAK